jgi:hypothetical protein
MIISFDQHVFVDKIDLRQTHVEAVSHCALMVGIHHENRTHARSAIVI